MALPTGIVRRQRADTPEAFRLFYQGSGTVTSVTVTTATNIVLISSDGGTETYVFATQDNVGKLVDAINLAFERGTSKFTAVVKDALRTNSTISQFLNGVIAVSAEDNSEAYWGALVDTSIALRVTHAIAGSNYTRVGAKGQSPDTRRVHLMGGQYFATLGAAGANGLLIYERNSKGIEKLVLSQGSVSAATQTFNFSAGAYISGAPGSEIIVVLIDGTSVADAGMFLQVSALID